MKVKVQKWGNSLAVRIPKSFAVQTQIEQDAVVNISVDKGKIIMMPEKKPEYTLDDLLQGVSKKNLHGETDSGMPVGNEIL